MTVEEQQEQEVPAEELEQVEPPAEEQPEVPAAEEEQPAAEVFAEVPADGEVTVSIGDEPAKEAQPAPDWVRNLRKKTRELERENHALRAAATKQLPVVGKEPSMADPDIDYDEEKYKAKYTAFLNQKRRADQEAERIAAAQVAEEQAWNAKLATYSQQKTTLKVKDFDDAESAVNDLLNERQLAVIVKYAKQPALVIYALGKNPGKAKQLSEVQDLLQFGIGISELEAQLKVTTKKTTPPAPEKQVVGSGSKSGSMDSHLDKLRDEAARTGDYTKVNAHKRKMAQAA